MYTDNKQGEHKYMRKFVSLLLILALILTSGCASDENQDENRLPTAMKFPVDIGIIELADHPVFKDSENGFINGLAQAGYNDGTNINIEIQNARNSEDNLKIIAQKFITDRKDIIFAISTPVAVAMAEETDDIPIIVAAVSNPAKSALVKTNESPGGNVSGISDPPPSGKQVQLITKLFPDAKKVCILYCSGEDNSRIQAEEVKTGLQKASVNVEIKTAATQYDIEQTAKSVVGNCDVVYIPSDDLFAKNISVVTDITTPANIPVITGDKDMVNDGALASVTTNYEDVGRLASEMAVKLIEGQDISTIPVTHSQNGKITINKNAAADLGITIPDEIENEADFVTGEENTDETETEYTAAE